jgi:CheY-like chemotaxis protein
MPDAPVSGAPDLNVNGPLVLVVDDSDGFATLVTAVLMSVGCRVDRAASGTEALRKVASGPPALILLDLHMPEMDGIGVLRRLRARPPFDKIPVIVLTATKSTDDVTVACSLGAKDYVPKPLDPANLITKVQRHLPARYRQRSSNIPPTVLKDRENRTVLI